jgi:hypothetical protein
MPTTPGSRGLRGRGETEYVATDSLMLLAGVREVAALASPAEPEAITQRAFDAARERSPAHTWLPPARRITERLKWPWTEVLSVAHEPEATQSKLLGLKNTKAPRSTDWLSESHVAAALQLVAGRLGADTVSMNEYRAEQGRIAAADHSRWFHGRQLLFPTDQQIVHLTGSWDEALRFAALRVDRQPGPTRKRPNSPTLVDLMERFYDAHDFQPTARDLESFARTNGIPYPGKRPNKAFSTAKREWRERRRAAGWPEPNVKSSGQRGGRARDHAERVGAALPGERRTDEWDRESCVAAVARYITQLGPRERSTSRGYRVWAAQQEHAPVMTTIQLHGGWEAVRRAALKTLRPTRTPSKSSVGDRRLVAKHR